MVREFTETKDRPSYDLALLQALAEADQIVYASVRNIEGWLDRLGYSHENLRSCIAMLSVDEFIKSGRYAIDASRFTFWMDVYRLKCLYTPDEPDAEPRRDDLYIKLSLSGDCVSVTVHSFHDWNRQV